MECSRWSAETYQNSTVWLLSNVHINRAHSVGLTENDWKHTIWFQARDRLHSAAVAKYPWFEMFHKMMSKHPSACPVTLVTSGAYDPVQASQSSHGDTGNAMEEDNNSFPSCCSIPGLETLAEGAPDDPIGPRVLSSSSAFPSPSTSSNPFSLPGATPCNHSASTAFGVDQEPESTGLSSPTKKTSASKKQDDIADLL
ncbi:uncharacterized protein UBRO_20696 [Ustilago bromivora]|uniref:Uncharacterized protein n=1 Tax=Ustilago bromivora TaxID=307758 RepID=A0A1K0GRG7_9BASI|nr:uncharacterized protein UBRO_20696 [Ustilago bromivora]